jgi:hypothetical protein
MEHQARDYTANKAEGRALARGDVPFLFRAFEAGQVRTTWKHVHGPLTTSQVLGAAHRRLACCFQCWTPISSPSDLPWCCLTQPVPKHSARSPATAVPCCMVY